MTNDIAVDSTTQLELIEYISIIAISRNGSLPVLFCLIAISLLVDCLTTVIVVVRRAQNDG